MFTRPTPQSSSSRAVVRRRPVDAAGAGKRPAPAGRRSESPARDARDESARARPPRQGGRRRRRCRWSGRDAARRARCPVEQRGPHATARRRYVHRGAPGGPGPRHVTRTRCGNGNAVVVGSGCSNGAHLVAGGRHDDHAAVDGHLDCLAQPEEPDREEISRGLAESLEYQEIGHRLGRDSSVISREVARHGGRARYRAAAAHEAARAGRERPKLFAVDCSARLRGWSAGSCGRAGPRPRSRAGCPPSTPPTSLAGCLMRRSTSGCTPSRCPPWPGS